MQYLPVVFAVFLVFYLTGLVIYYMAQAIFRIGLQYYITHRFYRGEHSLGQQAVRAGNEARELAAGRRRWRRHVRPDEARDGRNPGRGAHQERERWPPGRRRCAEWAAGCGEGVHGRDRLCSGQQAGHPAEEQANPERRRAASAQRARSATDAAHTPFAEEEVTGAQRWNGS